MSINFEDDKQDQLSLTTDTEKTSLAMEVQKLSDLQDDIETAEKHLKDLKAKEQNLSGKIIPEMMQEMNMQSMKLADGSAVEVKPVYGASIPVAKKEEAYNWLRNNGLGDIIKNNVTVSFGRNEDDKATAYSFLAKSSGYEPVQALKVEPQTLKAVLRERVESGQDVPTDVFNLFVGSQTKITKNKR